MQRLRKDQKVRIAPLFKNFHQPMVHSCLENRMGCAYADNTDIPVSAQIIIGAFSFLQENQMKTWSAIFRRIMTQPNSL